MAAGGDFGLYNAVLEVPWPEIVGQVDPNQIAFVDLGGADGSVVTQILHKYPELRGKFLLQDLPGVIGTVSDKLDKRIGAMPHDFFTEQPVHGRIPKLSP